MEISGVKSNIRYLMLFIILVLTQVLICNNILLFGVAMPFVFIFFILTLPLDTNLNILMLLSFLIGFFVDLFSDTLGLDSLACLFLSVLKKPLFFAYMPKEDKFKTAVPSIVTMGFLNYSKFIFTASALCCLLIFGIEFFSFASFGRIIVMCISSTVFTMLALLATDALFNKERQ